MRACELAHKREARTRSKITASQEEAAMSAAAYTKVVVVALSLMALTVAELGAKLLETQTSVASGLTPVIARALDYNL